MCKTTYNSTQLKLFYHKSIISLTISRLGRALFVTVYIIYFIIYLHFTDEQLGGERLIMIIDVASLSI
jgi:hypothetical protein